MARPYSSDLRQRVVAGVERGGLSCRRAAARFGVGLSTAIRWVARYRRTGSVAADKVGGCRPKLIAGAHRDWLLGVASAANSRCAAWWQSWPSGAKADCRTVWNFVRTEGLSFKKAVLAGEQDRRDIARRRAQWPHSQRRIDPARLMFIDS